LVAAKARDAQMSVAIKGDARAQYAKVITVIDLCNRLQVNMGLVTSRIGN
jgi:biopolymer transport protein ExbD